MGRILAIDYGRKRTGIAVTDPSKIIATPLDTYPTKQVMSFLKQYHISENIEEIVIGMPKNLQNNDTDSTSYVRAFITLLEKEFPGMPIRQVDERFTSKMAFQSMIDGGMRKSERRKKENVDKLSATIILQSFLESRI
ncbi:Holliday junction resolvase RuvX [Reichenbachiella sp. MALMAid0571]|uniref:Holliday junction resolvase RuvX n=1 Tax=Reichenbachiella sp. MALMAid0571 TaxID=3143939 RepID=UPI0032DED93A